MLQLCSSSSSSRVGEVWTSSNRDHHNNSRQDIKERYRCSRCSNMEEDSNNSRLMADFQQIHPHPCLNMVRRSTHFTPWQTLLSKHFMLQFSSLLLIFFSLNSSFSSFSLPTILFFFFLFFLSSFRFQFWLCSSSTTGKCLSDQR